MTGLLSFPLVAVFTQPAAFCQFEMVKASPAQVLLIRSEVETALGMLQTISAKQQEGELTLQQAKQHGADLLCGLRFGEDGYFGADTTQGVNAVLHGQKDAEGENRLPAKGVKGKAYRTDFVAKAKAGG